MEYKSDINPNINVSLTTDCTDDADIHPLGEMNDAPVGLEGSWAGHLESSLSEWQTTDPSTANGHSRKPIHFPAYARFKLRFDKI